MAAFRYYSSAKQQLKSKRNSAVQRIVIRPNCAASEGFVLLKGLRSGHAVSLLDLSKDAQMIDSIHTGFEIETSFLVVVARKLLLPASRISQGAPFFRNKVLFFESLMKN